MHHHYIRIPLLPILWHFTSPTVYIPPSVRHLLVPPLDMILNERWSLVCQDNQKRLKGRWKKDTHRHLMKDKCLKILASLPCYCMYVCFRTGKGGQAYLSCWCCWSSSVDRDGNVDQYTQPLSLFLSLSLFSVSMSLTIFSFLLALSLSFTLLSPSSLPIFSRHVFPAALPRCVSMPPLLSFSSPCLLQCPLSPFSSLSLSV